MIEVMKMDLAEMGLFPESCVEACPDDGVGMESVCDV